jgi:long-chain acyl-CoA synthetase
MEKLTDLLRTRRRESADRTAYLVRANGGWKPITWSEADDRVDRIAAGLVDLGLQPGDVVSILGRTRLEWALCDLAVLRAGGVSVGIYPTLIGDQCAFILEDSSTRWLFLEDARQAEKLSPFLAKLPRLDRPILWDPPKGQADFMCLQDLEERGRNALEADPELTLRTEEKIQAQDVAVLIYTSGTTGPPKGAMLTHRNIMAELELLDTMGATDQSDVMMFFLPLAHVGERVPGHYSRIYRGVSAAFVEDFNRILDDIREIRPTVFGSVPRVFEKAYARVRAEVDQASHPARRIFLWAERVGRAASRLQQAGRPLPLSLRLQRVIADRLVFRKIRAIFGGRVRYFLSSSAPISLEIIEFFHAAGMLILEAWGQTEVSCFATLNFEDDYRLGSVGKPLPGTELRIADDGEILVRGDIVFKGYLNQPELTAETLTADGWIRTGDLGRIDEDGFLWITGRKKEIIITAGGKNITPANIENMLKDHPLIDQALVHGDRRKYLTALLGLDPANLEAWAAEKGIEFTTYEAILSHPTLLDEVQGIVDAANRHFARYETVKRFALLPRPLDVERGELTPTMKIRRKIVEERFKDLLDSLYEEQGG